MRRTHVFQNDTHKRLLTYAADSDAAFLQDPERIKRADYVVVMIFSEFGRRAPDNVNLGTDHGAANLMFVAGKPVKGGQYGEVPSLIDRWLGYKDTQQLLNGQFQPFDMFT